MSRAKKQLKKVQLLLRSLAETGTLEHEQAQHANRLLRRLQHAKATRDSGALADAIDQLAAILLDVME